MRRRRVASSASRSIKAVSITRSPPARAYRSVALLRDGSFGSDARGEITVPRGAQAGSEISEILFDNSGNMLVAERGAPSTRRRPPHGSGILSRARIARHKAGPALQIPPAQRAPGLPVMTFRQDPTDTPHLMSTWWCRFPARRPTWSKIAPWRPERQRPMRAQFRPAIRCLDRRPRRFPIS